MWSTFTITSCNKISVVRDRLAKSLRNRRPSLFNGATTFRGQVWDDGFRMTRNFEFTERGLPFVATGRFIEEGDTTIIRVSTRPHWGSCFALLLVGAICFTGARAALSHLSDDANPWGTIAIFGSFFLFMLTIAFVASVREERLSQSEITRICCVPEPKSQ